MFWACKPEQKGKGKKGIVRMFISGAEERGADDLPESDAAGKNVLGKWQIKD